MDLLVCCVGFYLKVNIKINATFSEPPLLESLQAGSI